MTPVRRGLAGLLALTLSGPALARSRTPEPEPKNPPVPRVRLHYVRRAIPRVRQHYIRPMIPRVRTHVLRKPPIPEVRTRVLVPPTQPKPFYQPLAPQGSRNERLMKVVRPPHYRDGLRYAREPDSDRRDIEQHRLVRSATGAPPKIDLKRGDGKRLREAVRKRVYEEQGVSRFSSWAERQRAEASVKARYQRALRTGEALELLYPERFRASR